MQRNLWLMMLGMVLLEACNAPSSAVPSLTATAGQLTPPVSLEATVVSTVAPPTTMPPPEFAGPIRLYEREQPAYQGAISADGRYTVFNGYPEGVDPSSGPRQIYLYDAAGETLTRISENSAGDPANFDSGPIAIAANGSTVAFWSYATNLVDLGVNCDYPGAGDECAIGSVYVYNVYTGELQHIEVGSGYGIGVLDDIDLSSDGRFLAFASQGARHRPGAWILDRSTGEFTQVNEQGLAIDLSADGQWVATIAPDSPLFPADTNEAPDIYLWDRQNDDWTWISAPHLSAEPLLHEPSGLVYFHEGAGIAMSLADDGSSVLFESTQPLVDAAYTPCTTYFGRELPVCSHVYLYSQDAGSLELISQSSGGLPGNGESSGAVLSPDGRFAAFSSTASNFATVGPLDCGGNNGVFCSALFIRDRVTGRTYLAGVAADGGPPNGDVWPGWFSEDSCSLIFFSDATNLVAGFDPSSTPVSDSYIVDLTPWCELFLE